MFKTDCGNQTVCGIIESSGECVGSCIDYKKPEKIFTDNKLEYEYKNTPLDMLINNHWAWMEGFVKTLDREVFRKEALEYIYKTAFKHGYKHALESSKDLENE